jgi:hypothetical protein
MPDFNRRELDDRARAYGFNRDTFEKVLRLTKILGYSDLSISSVYLLDPDMLLPQLVYCGIYIDIVVRLYYHSNREYIVVRLNIMQ